MPKAYKSMLKFFQLANDVPGYRELAALEEAQPYEDDEAVEEVEIA